MRFKFIIKPPQSKEFENEFSAFKKDFPGEVEAEFSRQSGPQNALNLARKATAEGFERIIIVGGDGLVHQAVNGIMEALSDRFSPDLALGIIPTGSGNDFAKELGIPKSKKDAFALVRKNKFLAVDLGKVNPVREKSLNGAKNKFFANCISFGFDAQVNREANRIKNKYKFLPQGYGYLLAALKEVIFKFTFYQLELKGEGVELKDKVVLAALTNTPSYGGMFKINPAADFQDGLLDLCYIKRMAKARALLSIFRAIKGTHIHMQEVSNFKVASLKVFSPEPLPWEMDGEVQEPEKEFEITVRPKAINVLVP